MHKAQTQLKDIGYSDNYSLQQVPYDIRTRPQNIQSCQRIKEEVRIKFDQKEQYCSLEGEIRPDLPQDNDIQRKQYINQNEIPLKINIIDEHMIPLEELCQRLGTNIERGLTTQVALARNLEQGDNKLPEKKQTPTYIKFLLEITNWFAIMLWIAAILCFITCIIQPKYYILNLYIGLILVFVNLLTGIITFNNLVKPQGSISQFKDMLSSNAKVLRDGRFTQISPYQLVKGDIIQVIAGDKVPADIRIIYSNQMKMDNSCFSRDVEPELKSTKCTHVDPFQSKNIAFYGTLCKQGRGKGIVLNISDKTVIGLNIEITNLQDKKSQFRIELERFALIIAIFVLVFIIIFVLIALFVVKYSPLECMIFVIGILIANVPQGLLGCVIISLGITAQKLAQKQILVKDLQIIQALGSATCIVSDKTGTITENKMKLQNLWYDGTIKKAHNQQSNGKSFRYEYKIDDPSFICLHTCAIICSDAEFDISQAEARAPGFKYEACSVIGDSLQAAIIKFYQPIKSITMTRGKYKLARNNSNSTAKIPYNSTNKYSLLIVQQSTSQSNYCIYIRGSPQKIWGFCSKVMYSDKSKDIDKEQYDKFDAMNKMSGNKGEKDIGFAKLHLNKDTYPIGFEFNTTSPNNFNFPMENFVFVGILSFMDPPRQKISYAVKKCKSAGVKVIMTTGDQPQTAAAIAKQTNIITLKTNWDYQKEGYTEKEALEKAPAGIIDRNIFRKAFEQSQKQGESILLNWVKKPQIIFARISAPDKLRIVMALQKTGHIVGVTGDGTGDSPVLKQADVGISMGIYGSDVSKDAADIILLNDDFSSIVDGIQQGRKVVDNLKKMIIYLLASNISQIWPFIAMITIQIPLPLSNILILCISIGTDIYPALSFAYQEPEYDIMTRKKRKLDKHLISSKLMCHAYGAMGQIATFAGFFAYFITMNVYGFQNPTLFGLVKIPAYNQFNSSNYNEDNSFISSYANNLDNLYNSGMKWPCTNYKPVPNFPDWLSLINSKVDLRTAFLTCNYVTGFFQPSVFFPEQCYGYPQQLSPISESPICFTTEALYYAQSAYFSTVVIIQWSNLFACKSIKTSFIYSSFNLTMISGIMFSGCLLALILYCPGVNKVLGGRPLPFFLLCPGLLFSILLLVWEQVRKFLMNKKSNGRWPNWWQRHLLW